MGRLETVQQQRIATQRILAGFGRGYTNRTEYYRLVHLAHWKHPKGICDIEFMPPERQGELMLVLYNIVQQLQ